MDLSPTIILLFIGGLAVVAFGLAGRRSAVRGRTPETRLQALTRSESQVVGGGFLMVAATLAVLRVPLVVIASIGLATLILDAARRRRRQQAGDSRG